MVLAPHYSGASIGEYQARATAAAEAVGVPSVGVSRWHDLPEHRSFLAAAVNDARATMPDGSRVVFTAHSLPERLLEGDPYPDELRESAEAIATEAGLETPAGWSLAWQSAGATPEPWRGPDVLAVIEELATSGAPGVVVCPQGFVTDHLEVAYDLDIEAARVAAEAGLAFGRTRTPNDDPAVMAALARRVNDTAAALSS